MKPSPIKDQILVGPQQGAMSSSQGNLPNGDDGDEETLRGRLRQLGVAPEKIAACTTPRMLGFLLQKVRGPENLGLLH